MVMSLWSKIQKTWRSETFILELVQKGGDNRISEKHSGEFTSAPVYDLLADA